jgi:hypothetical protein
MTFPDPELFYWNNEEIEIPVKPELAAMLNRYIGGMERVRGRWRRPSENTELRTTNILGVELGDDLIGINYSRDCCLSADVLDMLNELIREIDRRYILRMMEIKKNVSADAAELTWSYGNFRRVDNWRPLMETAPVVTDSIKVECRVYNEKVSPTYLNFKWKLYRPRPRIDIIIDEPLKRTVWQFVKHKLWNW